MIGFEQRILLAAALTTTALISVPLARSTTAFTTCGIVSGGGAKWSVVATRVSCAAAKPLVKTPASKPRTGLATRLGTQLGLKCTEFARSRSREIACISTDGARSVYGITPPRK
jgi:hypothetical protein